MMGFWKYYNDIENYSSLSDDEKDNVINIMENKRYFHYWNYLPLLKILIPQITPKKAFSLVKGFISEPKLTSIDTDRLFKVIFTLIDCYGSDQEVKDLISSCKKKTVPRVLLGLKGISVDEEILGLRGLQSIGVAPDFVYAVQYKPSKDAIKALPPVMRLKVFEALLSNTDISYNIFENFAPDEFKSLLFGAVLRHRERTEEVWNRFQEVRFLGKESAVSVEYECVNCQKFKITIDSVRVRTETGLKNTQIGYTLMRNTCPLCGRYGEDNIKRKLITYTDDN